MGAVKSRRLHHRDRGQAARAGQDADGRLTSEGDGDGTIQIDVLGSLQELDVRAARRHRPLQGPDRRLPEDDQSRAGRDLRPVGRSSAPTRACPRCSPPPPARSPRPPRRSATLDAYRVAAVALPAGARPLVPGITQGVDAKLWIDKATSRLLKVELPLGTGDSAGTVTVTFHDYDAPVEVTAPMDDHVTTSPVLAQASGDRTRRRVALGVGGAAVLLAALDAYVVVTVLIDIAADVGVPLNRLERATPVVTGFLLGLRRRDAAARPALRPVRQASADPRLPGRRSPLGSALTALAPAGAGWWPAARSRGWRGGALLPITMALIGDLWDARAGRWRWAPSGRPRSWAACSARSTAAGSPPWLGWRGIFWVNIPLAALAARAVWRHPARRAPPCRRRRVDLVGGRSWRSPWGAGRRALQPRAGEGRASGLGGAPDRGRGGRGGRRSWCGRSGRPSACIDLSGVRRGAVPGDARGELPDRRRPAGHPGRRATRRADPAGRGRRRRGPGALPFPVALSVAALLGGCSPGASATGS